MLVSNPCIHDTRVIRAAETVAELGFDTVVLALSDDDAGARECRNGVVYKRIPKLPRRAKQTPEQFGDPIFGPSEQGGRPPNFRPPPTSPLPRGVEHSARTRYRVSHRIKRKLGNQVRKLAYFVPRPLIDTRRISKVFERDLLSLRPDIIHAHDLVTLPTAAAASKVLGSKLIYDAHELEVHRNTRNGAFDKWLRFYLERRHIKQCDAVVTVCDSIADYLAREYSIARPAVVMNAPETHLGNDRSNDLDLRSHLKLPKSTPLAVYVGRITIGRGIDQMVEAMQYLPDFHLALVGPANAPTVAQALKIATSTHVIDRIHTLKPVAADRVASFIRTADVSVVPIQNVCLSYYYCLPNKLLESAMAGLPVVVSNMPELRRFVEISAAGVVMDEADPKDIARAVQEAYKDRCRLRLTHERLPGVEKIYGWSKQRDTLRALYGSLGRPQTASPTTFRSQKV